MKKYLIIILIFLVPFTNYSQQQWRFHLAFEDATGAKDTVWLVWDTTANITLPVDTSLGEGRVQMNYNDFNVFVYNFNNDSTKTVAIPYSYYPIMEAQIGGFNFSYPIQISWDSSLFHAPYLPYQQGSILTSCLTNDYFYFTNNDPWSNCFSMHLDNHVDAPAFFYGSQNQFPMFLHFDGHGVNIETIQSHKKINISPNPASEIFSISSEDPIIELLIIDILGNEVYKNEFQNILSIKTINISEFNTKPKGIYLIKIKTILNQIYYEKFIKLH